MSGFGKSCCVAAGNSVTRSRSRGGFRCTSIRQLRPQLGPPSIFHEGPLLIKAVVQNQNFEFPVVNGCSPRHSRHSPKTCELPHRAQCGSDPAFTLGNVVTKWPKPSPASQQEKRTLVATTARFQEAMSELRRGRMKSRKFCDFGLAH